MIYTFYSFKGGVGRSMALANVAELLYRHGLKVLMIDFDLEAPGLESYFDVRGDEQDGGDYGSLANIPKEVEAKRGLIDLLVSYKNLRGMLRPEPVVAPATAALALSLDPNETPNGSSASGASSFTVEPLSNFICQIYKKNQKGGELHLLPAGRRANAAYCDKERDLREFARYAERVRAFPWNDFYNKWDGQRFFEWFRNEADKFADVVLVDSRTGVTEMSGICTYHLADVVVMFTAPNKQNLEGTKKIADSLKSERLESEGRKGRKLSMLFVPSRVEVNEKAEVDKFANEFKAVFDPLLPPTLKFREGDSFSDLTIRYVPYYSFRDEVAVRDRDSHVAGLLVKVYEELCLTFAKLEPDPDSKLRGVYTRERLTEGNDAEQQNRAAQVAFARLEPPDQKLARSVLIRLVRVAQPGEASGDSCLRLSIKEFSGPALKTLHALSEQGLVVIEKDATTGEEVAQLAEEGYLRHWTRLKEWLDGHREFLIWRQNLKANIEQWNNSKRERAALLSGKSLTEAKHWRASHEDEMSDTENLFIIESSRYETKLFVKKIVLLALVLLLGVGAAWYVQRQRSAQLEEAQLKEQEKIKALYLSYNESAREWVNNNDFKSAIDFYTRAINLQSDDNDAEAFNGRGKAFYQSGQLDAALNDFNRAFSLKPDYAEALLNRGVVYLTRDELDQALEDFNRAIAIKPDNPEAYYYRGNVLSEKGDHNGALRDYGRALLLKNDNYPEVYLQRGLVYKTLYGKDKAANPDAKDKAVTDLTNAMSLTDIPGLRTEAMRNLEELVGKEASATELPSAQPPMVFIHYNSPDDEGAVARVSEAISAQRVTVQGMQTSENYTEGDVRYYYPEDRKNANKVRDIVAKSLAEQGHERSIKVRFLGNYYRNVSRGSIELWIPALKTEGEVDQLPTVEPPALKAQPAGRPVAKRRG